MINLPHISFSTLLQLKPMHFGWHSLIYFCIFVIFVMTLTKIKINAGDPFMTGIWKLRSEKTWFLTVHIFSCHTVRSWVSDTAVCCLTVTFCGIIFYIPWTIHMVEKLIFLLISCPFHLRTYNLSSRATILTNIIIKPTIN